MGKSLKSIVFEILAYESKVNFDQELANKLVEEQNKCITEINLQTVENYKTQYKKLKYLGLIGHNENE